VAEPTETPKILEELSKSNTAKPQSRSSRQQQTARRRFAIVLVLFLPVVAAVLLLAYQQISLKSELASLQLDNQRLGQSLTQQNQQLQQVTQEQQNVPQPAPQDDSAVRELEGNVNQEIEQLNQQIAQLQSEQVLNSNNVQDQQWKILEAEYLLGIASQKLQLEKDLDTAASLLESADQALLASGSNNIFAVRQAIAEELLSIQNTEALDTAGIYLSLTGLLSQMEAIDLLNSMRENFEGQRELESEPVQIGVDNSSRIDSSLEFLGSIFVWRKWDEAPEAMLAPGQDVLIKQNLRLMLEQAQLALLVRDENLYQQSLLKSKDWFQRYAVTNSTEGQAIGSDLDQLIAIDIDPEMPSLSQSLSLIGQLVAGDR